MKYEQIPVVGTKIRFHPKLVICWEVALDFTTEGRLMGHITIV